jgi:hypothetical protein
VLGLVRSKEVAGNDSNDRLLALNIPIDLWAAGHARWCDCHRVRLAVTEALQASSTLCQGHLKAQRNRSTRQIFVSPLLNLLPPSMRPPKSQLTLQRRSP